MHRVARHSLSAAAALAVAIAASPAPAENEPPAKPRNIVVMVADGSGFNHFEAASLYRTGSRNGLNVHKFPVRLACSTFPAEGAYDPAAMWKDFGYAKSKATDSAAAATALATGYKTANGCLGITATRRAGLVVGDTTIRTNIMERAEARRKSTGVVTSVPISHATPAGYLVHAAERGDYTDIARQMFASAADVIIGCGHPEATNEPPPKSAAPTYGSDPRRFVWVGGEQTWTQLVAGVAISDADADGTPDPWTLVQDTASLCALTSGPAPQRLLGVVRAKSTLQQARAGDPTAPPYEVPLTPDMPALADLTRAALNVLDDNTNGYVLLVEGGAVDWASHVGQSGRSIEETLDFCDAVDAVLAWMEVHDAWDRTLLIVTADHETGYLLGPNSGRKSWWQFWQSFWKPLTNRGQGRLPGMAWYNRGHTNQLVPLFAIGAGANELAASATGLDPVRGRYLDNTDIAKVIFRFLD
jgi:alkaline phosphatase